MKKGLKLLLAICLSITLVSCVTQDHTNEDVIDTIKPIIRINADYRTGVVMQGETQNLEEILRKGVTAIDDIDGTITDKIIMDTVDLDVNVPGIYEILFYVVDSSNNQSETVSKMITVMKAYQMLERYDIYTGVIANEAKKPTSPSCFQGAWYHKVFSSQDYWSGIEGTVTIPKIKIGRYDGPYDETLDIDPMVRGLDNPSIYMGGKSSTESDVGLSLMQTEILVNGNKTISPGSYAFRPFWRYISTTQKDEGGYDLPNGRRYANTCRGNNCIAHWYYGDTQYYYLPGDKVRIIIYSPEANYMQMQIEVIEKSTLASSIKIRKDNKWADPENFISPKFHSLGHGTSHLAEYKRVNAIDQAGNEGKPIIQTTTEVKDTIWESVYLYREISGKMYRVPLNSTRSDVMNCPDSRKFTASPIDFHTGGTIISIHPGYNSKEQP